VRCVAWIMVLPFLVDLVWEAPCARDLRCR
jgi:hypothetical protein